MARDAIAEEKKRFARVLWRRVHDAVRAKAVVFYWLEQSTRHLHTQPDPAGIAFMK